MGTSIVLRKGLLYPWKVKYEKAILCEKLSWTKSHYGQKVIMTKGEIKID